MQSITKNMDIITEEVAPSKTAAKTVTLVAFNPKTQSPCKASPLEDHTGMVWTGQGEHGYYNLLTEAEKKLLGYVITPSTTIILEDGKVFNIETNPADKANWKWLQKHPYIAHDRENYDSRVARFYIADAAKDAEHRVDSTKDIDKARYLTRELSQADLMRVAKTLGLSGAESFTPGQLLDFVLSKASMKETVKAVLEAIDPANRQKSGAIVFFNDIVRWGVIERMKDGNYYFGGENGALIGVNQDTVIEYLLERENAERVKAMKTMLAEKTKVKE